MDDLNLQIGDLVYRKWDKILGIVIKKFNNGDTEIRWLDTEDTGIFSPTSHYLREYKRGIDGLRRNIYRKKKAQ